MTNPLSGGGGTSDLYSHMLPSVKITSRDMHLLETPFGKMFTRAAPDEDRLTLLKQVKLAVDQYCKDIVHQMKHEMARMEKAARRLKNVAQGGDPYSD